MLEHTSVYLDTLDLLIEKHSQKLGYRVAEKL